MGWALSAKNCAITGKIESDPESANVTLADLVGLFLSRSGYRTNIDPGERCHRSKSTTKSAKRYRQKSRVK